VLLHYFDVRAKTEKAENIQKTLENACFFSTFKGDLLAEKEGFEPSAYML